MMFESDGVTLYNGDCLDVMDKIPDKSIDLVLCDLPYAITDISWDVLIPFDKLWNQYNRILKESGNVVLFSSGQFTFKVAESNLDDFRYRLIWKKNVPTGMSSARYRPMKYFEEICVFNKGAKSAVYNPQMKERVGEKKQCYNYEHYCGDSNHIQMGKKPKKYDPDYVQPSDVLEFDVVPNRNGKIHPTEKPVKLLEYLIRTYSNENAVVLDNCMGSASTGIAAIRMKRKFIGIEKDKSYYDKCVERIQYEQSMEPLL